MTLSKLLGREEPEVKRVIGEARNSRRTVIPRPQPITVGECTFMPTQHRQAGPSKTVWRWDFDNRAPQDRNTPGSISIRIYASPEAPNLRTPVSIYETTADGHMTCYSHTAQSMVAAARYAAMWAAIRLQASSEGPDDDTSEAR